MPLSSFRPSSALPHPHLTHSLTKKSPLIFLSFLRCNDASPPFHNTESSYAPSMLQRSILTLLFSSAPTTTITCAFHAFCLGIFSGITLTTTASLVAKPVQANLAPVGTPVNPILFSCSNTSISWNMTDLLIIKEAVVAQHKNDSQPKVKLKRSLLDQGLCIPHRTH